MSGIEAPSGAAVVIGCMDRRLVGTLRLFENDADSPVTLAQKLENLSNLYRVHDRSYEELRRLITETHGKKVIILSNAGANVRGLEATLKGISKTDGISRIILLPHNMCGGMSLVARGLYEHATEESDVFFGHLHGSLYSAALTSGAELKDVQERAERLNPDIQREAAGKFSKSVDVVFVDLNKINLNEEGTEHYAIVALPGRYAVNFNGTPRDQTYGIFGLTGDTKIDVKIAGDALGIHHFIDLTVKGGPRKKLKS